MQNIFDQFQGADLDRLTDCLKAIRQAGLSVDKYTQAGVNPTSGNVWVWSEDWYGSVYCSISFDVQWCYSCPECGEEHDFDTYEELKDYVIKHDYSQCESCQTVEVNHA